MHYFLDRIISDKDVVRLIKKWRHDPVSFLKEDADNNRESFKVLTENLEIGIEVLFKEVTEANKEHRYPEILEAREQFRKNSQKYSFDYIQRMLTRQSEKEIKNKQKADDNLKRQKSILSQRQALDRSISTFIKENSKKFETISPAEFAKEISEHFQSTYEKIISLETSLAGEDDFISFLKQNSEFAARMEQLKKLSVKVYVKESVGSKSKAHLPKFIKKYQWAFLPLLMIGLAGGKYIHYRFFENKNTPHTEEQARQTANFLNSIAENKNWKNLKGMEAVRFFEQYLDDIHYHPFYETTKLNSLFLNLESEELKLIYEIHRFIGQTEYEYHLRSEMESKKKQLEDLIEQIKSNPYLNKEVKNHLIHRLYVAIAIGGLKYQSSLKKNEIDYGFKDQAVSIDYMEYAQKLSAINIKKLSHFVGLLEHGTLTKNEVEKILSWVKIKNLKEEADEYLTILFFIIGHANLQVAAELQPVLKNKLDLLLDEMKKQKVTSAKFDAEDIEIRYCRLIYIDLFRKGDYLSLVKIYAAALDHPIKDQFKLSNNENKIVKYYKSALNKSDKNWDYPFYEKTLFAFNLIAVGYEEEGFRELTSIYFFLINNKYQLVLRSIPYNKKITKQVLGKFKKYLTEKGDKTAADQIDRNFIQE